MGLLEPVGVPPRAIVCIQTAPHHFPYTAAPRAALAIAFLEPPALRREPGGVLRATFWLSVCRGTALAGSTSVPLAWFCVAYTHSSVGALAFGAAIGTLLVRV